MSCSDFTDRTETVMGQPVAYRKLTLVERRITVGKQRGDVSPFALIGRVNGGSLELWKANGRWREDDQPHPLDLAISVPAKG